MCVGDVTIPEDVYHYSMTPLDPRLIRCCSSVPLRELILACSSQWHAAFPSGENEYYPDYGKMALALVALLDEPFVFGTLTSGKRRRWTRSIIMKGLVLLMIERTDSMGVRRCLWTSSLTIGTAQTLR